MEEDIQNYSPIVMFRGTPCMNVVCYLVYYKPFSFHTVSTLLTKN